MPPEEVAKNLGVDLLTVSKWQSGDEPVPAEAIQHLLKMIDMQGNEVPSHRFKAKHLICTIILGALLLCGLILNFTVKPHLMEQWINFRPWIIWYMVYIEGGLYAAAGALLPALVSLKADIVIHGKPRWILLFLGLASISLYLYLGVWMTFAGFRLPRILRPLVRVNMFQGIRRVIPFFFGLTTFLGTNH